jgi:hypothetical protein
MWRAAAIVPLVFVAAACGGGDEKPLAQTARPCLAKLGEYVHHKRVKGAIPADPAPRLPLLDPDMPPVQGQTPTRIEWPEDFQEYGEVLYPPSNPGANAVQIFIFGDEELPARIMATTRRAERNQTFFLPATKPNRIGQSIVQWSSRPSAKQRTTVRACLTRA